MVEFQQGFLYCERNSVGAGIMVRKVFIKLLRFLVWWECEESFTVHVSSSEGWTSLRIAPGWKWKSLSEWVSSAPEKNELFGIANNCNKTDFVYCISMQTQWFKVVVLLLWTMPEVSGLIIIIPPSPQVFGMSHQVHVFFCLIITIDLEYSNKYVQKRYVPQAPFGHFIACHTTIKIWGQDLHI